MNKGLSSPLHMVIIAGIAISVLLMIGFGYMTGNDIIKQNKTLGNRRQLENLYPNGTNWTMHSIEFDKNWSHENYKNWSKHVCIPIRRKKSRICDKLITENNETYYFNCRFYPIQFLKCFNRNEIVIERGVPSDG